MIDFKFFGGTYFDLKFGFGLSVLILNNQIRAKHITLFLLEQYFDKSKAFSGRFFQPNSTAFLACLSSQVDHRSKSKKNMFIFVVHMLLRVNFSAY